MASMPVVNWPDHYQPSNAPVHVRNELDMQAAQEQVWAWLVRVTLWPAWYQNSSNVTILEGSGPDLVQGTRFRWHTFSATITSTVQEYLPRERIAWDAHGIGIDAYHAFIIQPSPKGCFVLTEEAQHGWLARLSHWVTPNRMSHFHQIWLEELERKARTGLPPAG